jgi:hypothetical protein
MQSKSNANSAQEPTLVLNPKTGRYINLTPLFNYLNEMEGTTVPGGSGAQSVAHNIKQAYRLITTTPIDPETQTPGHVSSVVADLFALEDVFINLTEFKS